MVLILEHFGQQELFAQVLDQPLLGGGFVQLKGDHIIRLQVTLEVLHHDGVVAAVGTLGCGGVDVADDLAAAAFADKGAQVRLFFLGKLLAGLGIPVQIIGALLLEVFVIAAQRLNVKLGIAVRTLHLLARTVKGDRAAAARALVFMYCHK